MRRFIAGAVLCLTWLGPAQDNAGLAKDYFLTIGGGYAPSGNQASLEANVLFFQQVLVERQLADRPHSIYFADGFDTQKDLQVQQLKPSDAPTVLQQLASIFRLDNNDLFYRNHQVPSISGGIRSSEIRSGLESIRGQLKAGDRLIVYVTAHGGSARADDRDNTSITCWGNKPLSMTTFSSWLDELPRGVTVVSVMAQCYCGGFANTLFQGGDPEQGFATNTRCGFFAQQTDLPAAGCRPDVENDEEYSSYFWGAFLGRSRSGKPASGIDSNGDGRISLAEAHAHAVVASDTIDIPLRTSDVFLRRFSRIPGYELAHVLVKTEESDEDQTTTAADPVLSPPNLTQMTGTIYEVAARGRPDETRIVVGLAEKLQIPVSSTIAELTERYTRQQQVVREARRAGYRRGRGSSSRRRLMAEIVEKWPELENPSQWAGSDLLAEENQAAFANELQQLPGFAEFIQGQQDRERARERALDAELSEVKFRRLLQQLESIVLAENLALVATPAVVEHFRTVVAAEEDSLGKL